MVGHIGEYRWIKEASMSSEPETNSRRRLLGTALAAGAGGIIAGALGGATAVGTRKAPTVHVEDRQRFRNKVVLITGATSGIGAAAAKMFAAEGGKVAFCGRREDRGAQVEREIKAQGGEVHYIRADVRIESDVQRFVDQAAERYGGLDVCFNNAGITIERPLHEYTAAEWDDVVGTDLRGNFLALKYEIPHLIRRGGGVVVVTASSNAVATTAKRSAYSAAKRGLVALVQAAAQDYADNNIRINTLIPGTTDTELVRRAAGMMDAPDAVWKAAAAVWAKSNVAVARRLATAEEIATVALALASDEFTFMTGAQIVVDGGKTAHA
jgi:NAD(P)-dependent dehydrogenase (short-subunit alcohol dehydrogenase family)